MWEAEEDNILLFISKTYIVLYFGLLLFQMTPLADLLAHINNETAYDNRTMSGSVSLPDYAVYDQGSHDFDKVQIHFDICSQQWSKH